MKKFRKFKQDKLARDKIVERLERDGSKIYWRKLTDLEYIRELKNKMIEESYEVQSAETKEKLIEELADVLELITSFCAFTLEDIIALMEQKRLKSGRFEERKFITVAEHQIGSYAEKYCLSDPIKYPEIE